MQKKIALILTLISFKATAEINSSLLKILSLPIEPKISCHIEDELRFKECIQSICGPALTNETYRDLFSDLYGKIPTTNADKETQLKKAAEAFVAKRIKFLEDSNALYVSPKDLANTTIDNDQKSFHKLTSLTSLFSSIKWENIVTDVSFDAPRMAFIYDETALKAALGSKSHLFPLLKEIMENPELQIFSHAEQVGWVLTNQALYPNLSQSEIFKKELDDMNRIEKDLAINYPKMFEMVKLFSLPDKKIIEKLQNTPDPSERLQSQFYGAMRILKLLSNYIKNGAPEFNKYNPQKLGDIYSAEEIEKKKKSNLLALKKLKEGEADEDMVNRCLSVFQKNQLAMPTEEENKSFQERAEKLRTSIKTKISTSLSKETATALSTPMDRIYLDMPSTKNEIAQLITNEVQELGVSMDRADDLINGRNPTLSKHEYGLGNLHSFMYENEENLLEDLQYACDNYDVPNINDASYNHGTGKILISWMSVKSPKAGEAVLAHEFGHALASIMQNTKISHHSAMKFKKARECLSGKMPQGTETSIHLSCIGKFGNEISFSMPESQYTEENWADLFSAKFTPESTPNVGCFLLDKKNGEYSDQLLMPEEHEDTHAPNIFRTIHVEFLRKKNLPSSCLNALTSEEKQSVMGDCLQ